MAHLCDLVVLSDVLMKALHSVGAPEKDYSPVNL